MWITSGININKIYSNYRHIYIHRIWIVKNLQEKCEQFWNFYGFSMLWNLPVHQIVNATNPTHISLKLFNISSEIWRKRVQDTLIWYKYLNFNIFSNFSKSSESNTDTICFSQWHLRDFQKFSSLPKEAANTIFFKFLVWFYPSINLWLVDEFKSFPCNSY